MNETHSTTTAASATTIADMVVRRLVPTVSAPEIISASMIKSKKKRPGSPASWRGRIAKTKTLREIVTRVRPRSPVQNSLASRLRGLLD
jgi:hypothetical protein